MTALSPAAGGRSAALPALPDPDPSLSQAAPVAVDPGGSSPGVPQHVTVRAGDRILVEGAGLGCQVNRRGGRTFVECGRTGDVAGTYMTLMGRKSAWVARLRSARRADVVLFARHRGRWRACGTTTSAARAAAGGCR